MEAVWQGPESGQTAHEPVIDVERLEMEEDERHRVVQPDVPAPRAQPVLARIPGCEPSADVSEDPNA